MNNRLILIGVLVIAVAGAIFYFLQQRNLQTFTKENTSLSFKYPKSWEEEDLTVGNLQTVVLVRVRPKGVEKVSLQVTQKTVQSRPSDEEIMAEVEKSLQENFSTFQLLDKPTIRTKSGKVPLLHYRYKTEKNEDSEQLMGVFWDGTTAYYLIGQAPPDQFKRYQGNFRQIMGSVSFEK